MDKSLVLAVAGSGKTRLIINSLSLDNRALIITYTNNNYENLRRRIIDKFGYLPSNISLYTYFSFLYSFCYLPCLYYKVGSRSINYNEKHEAFPRRGVSAADFLYYMDWGRNLLGNRLALMVKNFAAADVVFRLEKFYDQLIIDEVQDFAANDFNFINSLITAKINILYVGDYYQHTYDTSRDGATRQSLYRNGYEKYKQAFDPGLKINDRLLITSYRCSKTICDYVTNYLGITVKAYEERESSLEIVEDTDKIALLANDPTIPKLFFESHANYECFSTNWGASKGIDHFTDVCVVLNQKTWPMAKTGDYSKIVSSTKNKLYVALTRARRNVYLISQEELKGYLKK